MTKWGKERTLCRELKLFVAKKYLDQRSAELRQQGIQAEQETTRGDPARGIVASVRRLSADLVIMGTHGRAGADAFWAESVAARVVPRIQAPLMLVPAVRSGDGLLREAR